jgi:hypothetical protein
MSSTPPDQPSFIGRLFAGGSGAPAPSSSASAAPPPPLPPSHSAPVSIAPAPHGVKPVHTPASPVSHPEM